MKFLLVNSDRSIASLGGEKGVEAALGILPVPAGDGITSVRRVLAALVDVVDEPVSGDLATIFGGQIETVTRLVPNEAARKLDVGGIVLDTLSATCDQEFHIRLAALNRRRADKGDGPIDSLDKSTWGPYGNAIVKLVQGFAQLEMPVVVTCHESKVSDDSGFTTYEPNIVGSASSRILRHFDAVLFSRVVGSGDDAAFVWQTRPDQSRPSARTRNVVLDFQIEQDFTTVFDAFEAVGTPHPKILVIGESGTGKTTSLGTLSRTR